MGPTVSDRLGGLEERFTGPNGIDVRLTRVEITLEAHDTADQERHQQSLAATKSLQETVTQHFDRLWKLIAFLLAALLISFGVKETLPNLMQTLSGV